jgi:hypothetical protein
VSHYEREEIWSRPLERVTSPVSWGPVERVILRVLQDHREAMRVRHPHLGGWLGFDNLLVACKGHSPRCRAKNVREGVARLIAAHEVELDWINDDWVYRRVETVPGPP